MVSHSGLLTVMERAARQAAPRLRRDVGEVEHLQVSRKAPADCASLAKAGHVALFHGAWPISVRTVHAYLQSGSASFVGSFRPGADYDPNAGARRALFLPRRA